MRKGDERKTEILQVSEKLFLTKGYEATSIQDILDVLHSSKGGFYHHFVSKDAVLNTLCVQHAEQSAERAAALLETLEETAPMTRLNALMRSFLPLQQEELDFMAMLLPTLDRQESVSVRVSYQEALAEAFRPLLEKEIAAARSQGVLFSSVPEVIRPVLVLLNQCWTEAALYLTRCLHGQQTYEPSALLNILACYRRGIEVLLDAPWGTVELLQLQEWNAMAESILK